MVRFALIALVAGCVADETTFATDESELGFAFTREHVRADIYHYELVLPIGSAPNAALRIHRVVRELAPFVPRPTRRAAMLVHGDFSRFPTNFLPDTGNGGLAPYLAAREIDVWGVDRRWTLATDDVSDFGDMGVAQELGDLRAALAVARGIHGGKLALVGFSHGGQLAYAYAATEATRAPALRHVDAIVPIDFYGELAPEDTDVRAFVCGASAAEYQAVADGVVDAPNDFLIAIGQLAATAPEEPSPIFDGSTNRGAMLSVVGQTYQGVPFAPFYHLASPILDGAAAIGLRESSESTMAAWLAGSTPHQSMREAADLDALLCGTLPPPVDAPLSRIRVPVFYIGAAGGIGSLGLHSTTAVSSSDVSTLIVQRFEPERRAEDFGHADLLYATEAPDLAWRPLASWLVHH